MPENSDPDFLLDRPLGDLFNKLPEEEFRPGSVVGPYTIEGLLGEGGMGSVYLARDPRLGRKVAIKVAAERFTDRFAREARAVAALNHPGICTLYDVGPNYLVMELVEGKAPTGPMAPHEVMKIAGHLVAALEAAHEKGIAHRDLKPANIKVKPDGSVKILDFGLARTSAIPGHDPEDVHTISMSITGAGSILGTPAFMSPEQVRGQTAGPRADIWAFGVVLYQLLTGKLPFPGLAVADVLAAILHREPDWTALPKTATPGLRKLVRLCLTRDLTARLQAIGDARIFLNAGSDEEQPIAIAPAKPPFLPWVLAGLFAVAALAIALWSWGGTSHPSPPFLQVAVDTGRDEPSEPAISPDGMRIVFVSDGRLALRRMDRADVTVLPGTEGASKPFFSPNGQSVAFFAAGKLRKIEIEGGDSVTLCDAPRASGGSWGDDDSIVAALNPNGALFRVPAAGGTPVPITEPRPGTRNLHERPQSLPAGKGVLFAGMNGVMQGDLLVIPQDRGKPKKLIDDATQGRYVPGEAGGHLIFVRRGTLFAAPMDLERMELTATPVPLVEGVAYRGAGADFDVSRSGTLVYRRENVSNSLTPAWLDSTGKMQRVSAKAGSYFRPRLSHDGKRLAMVIVAQGQQNIWLYDLERDVFTRLTNHPSPDGFAVWSPDDEFIALRTGDRLGWIRSDGAGKIEYLPGVSPNATPNSFSPRGDWLAFFSAEPGGTLWAAAVERSAGQMKVTKPRVLLRNSSSNGGVSISPDGKWAAYVSDESGRFEIYVRPFAPNGGAERRWQVSRGGGFGMAWSGRDLFYLTPTRRVEAAAYRSNGDVFEVEKPRPWADKPVAEQGILTSFDVSADGKRVMALFGPDEAQPEKQLRVMLNLKDELSRRFHVRAK